MDQYKGFAEHIKSAKKIILTTHKNCDADGMGSELALYFALKQIGKDVRVIHFEAVHPRYQFLDSKKVVEVYKPDSSLTPDLIIAFDTNDNRLIEPLYTEHKSHSKVLFLDHHQILKSGPQPTEGSVIDSASASTGEMTYKLIQALEIKLNADIAYALYTSIAFDTHIFKYIRSSKQSFLIAADLLSYDIDSTYIHRMLFANASVYKLKFLAQILNQIEFSNADQTALCFISSKDMKVWNAGIEDTHDILDHILSVGTCKLAILVREIADSEFRISFRSKGKIKVLGLAEKFNGGGHNQASGATVNMDYKSLKQALLKESKQLITG